MVNLETRRRSVFSSVKAELREVALDVFAKRGFDFVTMRDIAFAAGISERIFARYFPEKENLLLDGLCESGPAFREALMALPRSMPLIEALQKAISTTLQPPIFLECVLAVVCHCENSRTLRTAFNERKIGWQSDMTKAIADWLGSTVETDFRPTFWGCSIVAAILFAVRAEAGEAGINAEFCDPGKVIDIAFEHLRTLTAPAGKLPSDLTRLASTTNLASSTQMQFGKP